MLTKIDKMHSLYGKGSGTCKECNRLVSHRVSDRQVKKYKCLNYGVSNAESTDWRLSYETCGMKDKIVDREVIKVRIAENKPEPQLEGQMRIMGDK